MINVVLYEPEIPMNTGNIMRTCAGTDVMLHLIEPLGFSLDEKSIKRSGANYVDKCEYKVYKNFDEFKAQNPGKYYFLTRYGNKTYTEFDYSNKDENIYFVFGKESTGIPLEILKPNFETCLRVPTNTKILALNLSNTVALVVYEALRQQQFDGLEFYDNFKGKDYIQKN